MTAVRQKFMSFLPGVGCGILLSALLSTYLLDLHPTSHSPLVTNHHALVSRDTTDDAQKDDGVRFCYPPLDSQLLQQHDINSTAFSSANSWMDTFLSSFINPKPNGTGTDSIAAAVVLPGGTVYAKGFGTLKANDSSSGGNVTADTLYRMASVTKVMTALEAFVLDQQGKLSMEGDITEYLPNFKFPSGNNATWRIKLGLDSASNSSDDSAGKRKITPLQLASEMAGLLRDEPVDQPWPLQLGQNIPVQVKMWVNGTAEQVLTSIGDSPADTGSWTYPIYSNMGFNLLGLVTAAADGGKLGYEDLLQQDIFGPLGMNSSFFKVPDARVAELAVSSLNSNWSDTDVGAHNPAGGLYSSATDLARFMRSLLNPSPTKSSDGLPSNFVLDSYGVRKWLSPLLRLDDDLTVVGAPWEMKSYMDTPSSGVNASNSRTTTLYTKAGDFPGYINLMVIDPAREFAFVILTTGANGDTEQMGVEIAQQYSAVIDAAREDVLREVYAGNYSASTSNGTDEMTIAVAQGSLWMTKLVVNQTDWLTSNGIGAPIPGTSPAISGLPLWPTAETGIFHFVLSFAPAGTAWQGCMPQWDDIGTAYSNGGIPFDLVALDNGVALIPAAGVRLTKQT